MTPRTSGFDGDALARAVDEGGHQAAVVAAGSDFAALATRILREIGGPVRPVPHAPGE